MFGKPLELNNRATVITRLVFFSSPEYFKLKSFFNQYIVKIYRSGVWWQLWWWILRYSWSTRRSHLYCCLNVWKVIDSTQDIRLLFTISLHISDVIAGQIVKSSLCCLHGPVRNVITTTWVCLNNIYRLHMTEVVLTLQSPKSFFVYDIFFCFNIHCSKYQLKFTGKTIF